MGGDRWNVFCVEVAVYVCGVGKRRISPRYHGGREGGKDVVLLVVSRDEA